MTGTRHSTELSFIIIADFTNMVYKELNRSWEDAMACNALVLLRVLASEEG